MNMANLFKVNGKFSLSKLAGALAITLGAGAVAGLMSMNAAAIYAALDLPSFAPPTWVFMPVWTVLYLLMGLALYRILMYEPTPDRKAATFYYSLQLIFNLLWSLLFFVLQLRLAAFVGLVILFFYIVVTTVKFFKIDKPSGFLMVPYLLWVVFAGILNFAVVMLNG